MFQLRDSFNHITLSKHRSAFNAGKAAAKHTDAVKRHNGPQSYCRFELRRGGETVDLASYDDADSVEFCRGLNGGAL